MSKQTLETERIEEWKTSDGQIIKIKDMTDSHLSNAIKYLQRHIAQAPLTGGGSPSDGEMAQVWANAEEEHNLRVLESLEEMVTVLQAEVDRRANLVD